MFVYHCNKSAAVLDVYICCEISNLLTGTFCISQSCRYYERTQSVISLACTQCVSDGG
jgi:hypothetical protein